MAAARSMSPRASMSSGSARTRGKAGAANAKAFSEKKQDACPAQRLGLTDHRLSAREVLRSRQFVTRVRLPGRLLRYYWRRVETRQVPNGRTHRLIYAY